MSVLPMRNQQPNYTLAILGPLSLSPGCRCLIQTLIWIIIPQEIQPLLLSPHSVCLFVPPICVNSACLFCVCVACPRWWRGHVAQALPCGSCLMSSWIHILHLCFTIYIFVIIIVWIVILLLIYSVDATIVYCMSVYPGRGILLCCSS